MEDEVILSSVLLMDYRLQGVMGDHCIYFTNNLIDCNLNNKFMKNLNVYAFLFCTPLWNSVVGCNNGTGDTWPEAKLLKHYDRKKKVDKSKSAEITSHINVIKI